MASTPWERFDHDPRQPENAVLRAGDRDRDVVLDVLGSAYAEGRLTPAELDERFAARVREGGSVGVMFHHGVMEADDMVRASDLLAVLATHENVVPRRMADLCP